jgi:signal transduction histidine kinase
LVVTKDRTSGRFCILDDEKTFLNIAKRNLSKFLPDVKGVFISSPDEIYSIAREDEKTLYIIDINLGEFNGMDIYRKISRISDKARVIFITGDMALIEDETLRRQSLSEGGIDFIEKPIKWHEMAIKIKNHLKLLEYQFELEDKVEERTQMLLHADRLATVGTMVSSIVHEISSPLTFIKANQETFLFAYNKAKDTISDPEAIKLFEEFILPGIKDSLSGVNRIEELLKSFRKFYKKEQKVTVNDIVSILNEVKNLTFYSMKKNRIAFCMDLKNDGDYSIKCNRQELIQVFTNIVNNAIDALEDHPVENKKIDVSVYREKKFVVISISNNGPAINDSEMEDIFKPFFTTKGDEKGTGLGLSIVRQITRNMGGDVWIKNKEDLENVEFIVQIPVNQDPKKI